MLANCRPWMWAANGASRRRTLRPFLRRESRVNPHPCRKKLIHDAQGEPYIFNAGARFSIAAISTGIIFLHGAMVGSGAETLSIGAAAATAAFFIGDILDKIVTRIPVYVFLRMQISVVEKPLIPTNFPTFPEHLGPRSARSLRRKGDDSKGS